MTKKRLAKMGPSVEERRALAVALAKCRIGITERPSERKKASLKQCSDVSRALRLGDHDEADRLRRLYWPERMRLEDLNRQRGQSGK